MLERAVQLRPLLRLRRQRVLGLHLSMLLFSLKGPLGAGGGSGTWVSIFDVTGCIEDWGQGVGWTILEVSRLAAFSRSSLVKSIPWNWAPRRCPWARMATGTFRSPGRLHLLRWNQGPAPSTWSSRVLVTGSIITEVIIQL